MQETWLNVLEQHRNECQWLKLYSNRQIMILLILLSSSSTQNQIKTNFLNNLYNNKSSKSINEQTILSLTIEYLKHYLNSLRIANCDLSTNNLLHLLKENSSQHNNDDVEQCLSQLSHFLNKIFHNCKQLVLPPITSKKNQAITTTNDWQQQENQQYLVKLCTVTTATTRTTYDFDMETLCTLLSIFNDELPSAHQILWCSIATEDDIQLFFSRIRTYAHLKFVLLDIDKMNHRLRELLFTEHVSLANQTDVSHGEVYYFSRELTCRRGMKPWMPSRNLNANVIRSQLITNCKQLNYTPPPIHIVLGTAGIGKTHRIFTKYKTENPICISINDKINLSTLIATFLSLNSVIRNNTDKIQTVYFNISINAPFAELNRFLFGLFISGTLIDLSSGLTFSLTDSKRWQFIIEVPYLEKLNTKVEENFDYLLPLLSICPHSSEEVTAKNYELFIGDNEELIARFLKAFDDKSIDRTLTINMVDGTEIPVEFPRLQDDVQCRFHIHRMLDHYAPEIRQNKIFELSFTKFLYRRIRFFTGPYYTLNQIISNLGSIVMEQMIEESKNLVKIDFSNEHFPKVYLVYDSGFSLQLLHTKWEDVPHELKRLMKKKDRLKDLEFKNRDPFIRCLSWLINIPYSEFESIINETKFVLTESFAYKLFHVHERKLTKLPLIIEGDTGVGKTFLLKFYSMLLNSKLKFDRELDIAPRILEKTSLWLYCNILKKTIEPEGVLLEEFLKKIKPILENQHHNPVENDDDNEWKSDNDDLHDRLFLHRIQPQQPLTTVSSFILPKESMDTELLEEIKFSLLNGTYTFKILRQIWKTLMTIANIHNEMYEQRLIIELNDYIKSQLQTLHLLDPSVHLPQLLKETKLQPMVRSIKLFNEYTYTQAKPLFYRLLLHPGVTEEQLKDFM
ncbi:unnamed protein product, partial [Didymodactylos carnosus]